MEENQSLSTENFHQSSLAALQGEFFRDLRESGKSTNTLKNYKTDIECFNKFLIEAKASKHLNEFNFTQVKAYGQFLQDRYQSDNSRRRRLQALRLFFDFLVKKSLFNENPIRKLPSSPKFLDIPRPTPLMDVEKLWNFLCEETKDDNLMKKLMAQRNQVIFLLVYTGALKVSDISGLKLGSIDNNQISPRVMVIPTKRDPYTVPLHGLFYIVYNEYMQTLELGKSYSKVEFDHVLFNANPFKILKGGLSPRGLELIFEEFRNKLNIQVTPKSLRQAGIFNWLTQGHNDSLIKDWMGVAPSYSLKLYKTHLPNNIFNDSFLPRVYQDVLGN